jgi:hypothetical protein
LSILFQVGLYLRANKEHVVEVIQHKLTIQRATITSEAANLPLSGYLA